MTTPIQSLVECGTKVWLDSVDPKLVAENKRLGATGATSNPIIISALIKQGGFDQELLDLLTEQDQSDSDAAWTLTDQIVRAAQAEFLPVWERTRGNDGWVSFELDPLLEDAGCQLTDAQRTARYVELGKQWSAGHKNRMIKIPATRSGLAAIEELVAAGVTLNVTLIFSARQYREARDAAWRGAQRRGSLAAFKSVYSIFVSRIDVYTQQHAPRLSPAAQGLVGIVNAQRLWRENQDFWAAHPTPLDQEIIFASTGTKNPSDPPWKYVAALAGSDIQTNPPATNQAVEESGLTFVRRVDQFPPDDVLAEIDREVDFDHLERTLMDEGLEKFADPQKALLKLVETRRAALTAG